MKLNLFQRLVRPSTRAFFAESTGSSGHSLFSRMHGYIYARWPYLYIGMATGRHPVARFFRSLSKGRKKSPAASSGRQKSRAGEIFARGYHGKAMPLQEAKKIIRVDRSVDLGDLEQIIPYDRARQIILNNPGHIAVLECPCRVTSVSPCKPLDVCLIIGEPFAAFILEHHPRRSRRINVDEACSILEAEHGRGHVQHAFFKEAMLGRFYAICNCCSCCCGAMQAHRNGVPMLASSGFTSRADPEQCLRCGECAGLCGFGAISMTEKGPLVSRDRCMGCGVCVDKCPGGCLTLVRDPDKCPPLDIGALLQRAAGQQ